MKKFAKSLLPKHVSRLSPNCHLPTGTSLPLWLVKSRQPYNKYSSSINCSLPGDHNLDTDLLPYVTVKAASGLQPHVPIHHYAATGTTPGGNTYHHHHLHGQRQQRDHHYCRNDYDDVWIDKSLLRSSASGRSGTDNDDDDGGGHTAISMVSSASSVEDEDVMGSVDNEGRTPTGECSTAVYGSTHSSNAASVDHRRWTLTSADGGSIGRRPVSSEHKKQVVGGSGWKCHCCQLAAGPDTCDSRLPMPSAVPAGSMLDRWSTPFSAAVMTRHKQRRSLSGRCQSIQSMELRKTEARKARENRRCCGSSRCGSGGNIVTLPRTIDEFNDTNCSSVRSRLGGKCVLDEMQLAHSPPECMSGCHRFVEKCETNEETFYSRTSQDGTTLEDTPTTMKRVPSWSVPDLVTCQCQSGATASASRGDHRHPTTSSTNCAHGRTQYVT